MPAARADDGVRRTADRFREQATACTALGSPLYADLIARAADDLLRGGPVAAAVRGHEHDPGPSALALRLMAAVHRRALDGRAPQLARHYPSAGGRLTTGPDGALRTDEAWRAFLDVVAADVAGVNAELDQAPQTNEVGRAAALVGGLLHVAARAALPVRLLELGTSAGLNLRADRFRLVDGDGALLAGDPRSPVVLDDPWHGNPAHRPPRTSALRVVERVGCDTAPVDPTDPRARLVLLSYVWPDSPARVERLRAACDVAARVPAEVRRQGAGDFVDDVAVEPGTWTVLWHSVMWQYVEPAERARISARVAALGAAAREDRRLARLSLEPRREGDGDGGGAGRGEHVFAVTLTTWPGGQARRLGTAHPHGIPVTWSAPPAAG